METTETLLDLAGAVRLRTAAYGELTAARIALDDAQARLKIARSAVALDSASDATLSASMRGREAIARIGVEEARERLSEARRDLQKARQLSGTRIVKEERIESLD